MKRLLLCLLLFPLSAVLQSQSSSEEVIYKHWAFLAESETYIDVSYRVIRCGSSNEVHLQIFNENPNDQVAKFDLEIMNKADGDRTTKDISFHVKGAEIIQGECNGGTATAALRVSLPAAYDPNAISVKLTFKP